MSRCRLLARIFCVAVVSIHAAACASNDIRWTEEVKLSDGRVIEIQRRVELTESGFPVQERGFRKSVEICYPPMNLRWKSSGAYVPDIFDIVDGKAYMHVPIGGCYECGLLGDPEPNAVVFVWEGGGWKRVAHDEFPERSGWNLLMSFVSAPAHQKNDPHGLITLQDKEKRMGSTLLEQKRYGWRRINEMHGWRSACTKCGRSQPNRSFTPAQEIFISDGKKACEQ